MELDYQWMNDILLRAGKLILDSTGREQILEKGEADFVTKSDIIVQKFIKQELGEKYPQIDFVGEEEKTIAYTRGMQWILDPIDGTTNYIYGYNHSAISLALKEEQKVIFGAVYNPFASEMFMAIKDKGAYLNGKRIEVNYTKSMKEALVAFGTSPYYKELTEKIFKKTMTIYEEVLDVRRTGSAALDLAYVACGRQDAYFEYRLKPWDYAAGILLVSEAGGYIHGVESDIHLDQPSDILACCSLELQKELLKKLQG